MLYLNIGLGIFRAKLKGLMGFQMSNSDFKIETELAPQYLVCPPFALVTALILLVIEITRALIRLMGDDVPLFYYGCGQLGSSSRSGWRCQTCLSNWFHRCSVGDKSGLYGGCRVVERYCLPEDLANPNYVGPSIILLQGQIMLPFNLSIGRHIVPICPRLKYKIQTYELFYLEFISKYSKFHFK